MPDTQGEGKAPAKAAEIAQASKPKSSEKEQASITGLKSTSKIPDISSIRATISSKKESTNGATETESELPVTVEKLKKKWTEFTEQLKKDGRDREFNTLNQKVEFEDNLTISLTLPNSFQSLTIEGLQQELLTYLRSTLKNKNIQLRTAIEKIEDKKMIYTNSEKFEYLAKKYPNLLELKKRLDLDTDF